MRFIRLSALAGASCLTAGLLVLSAAPASAVVPQCLVPSGELGCVSITSALAGSRYALAVNARRPAAGSSFILLRRLADDAAQDYHPSYEGTVGQLEEEAPGLLGSAIGTARLARDPVYEFGYAREAAALCIGIAAGNGTAIALEPCGVDAGTLWVISGNSASRHVALINGTSGSALYGLTVLGPARGSGGTERVILSVIRQRGTPASQLWTVRPSI
jgi:hypothetical protein